MSSRLVTSRSLNTSDGHPLTFESKNLYRKGSLPDDDKNTIKFKTGTKNYEIDRSILREYLTSLKAVRNLPERKLDTKNASNLKTLREISRMLRENTNPALYEIFVEEVMSVFSDVQSSVPGTVGAYFVGCFKGNNFEGPIGCSAHCAGSMAPGSSAKGFAPCSDNVFFAENNELVPLYETDSDQAYIYFDAQSRSVFTPEMIEILKEKRIEKVIIVSGDQNGKYKESSDPIPLARLSTSSVVRRADNGDGSSSGSDSSYWVLWIILAVLILIIILALVFKDKMVY